QTGPFCQRLVERVELGAKFLRRRARPLVAKTFLGGALPEFDLDLLFAIGKALHGAAAVCFVTLQRGGRLRRTGRGEYEAEAQRPQIEMQIVFVLEQRRDLVLTVGRDQSWRR